MIKQIIILFAIVVMAAIMISRIPKEIATPIALFLVIFGVVALVLALAIFGFKKIPEKLWWD